MPLNDGWITAAQFCTGGLGGAILTLVVKSISDRRRQKRVLINTQVIPYTLPAFSLASGVVRPALHVAYNGVTYEHLFRYCVMVRNLGTGAVPSFLLVLLIPLPAEVVASFVRVEPMQVELKAEFSSVDNAARATLTTPRLSKWTEVF